MVPETAHTPRQTRSTPPVAPEFLPPRWRFVSTPPGEAAWNMAVDDALLAHARRESIGIVRCYSWSAPSVSFGRNEVVRGRFDEQECRAAGVSLVRRPTGGRALLHDAECTFSFSLPIPDDVSWRTAYDALNIIVCDALRLLGVNAAVAERGTAIVPGDALCFAAPSAGEITVGGAKLVGSAVWREHGAFLQQGSILIDGSQELLRRLAHGGGDVLAPVATMRGCGAPTSVPVIAAAIMDRLSRDFTVEEWPLDAMVQREAASRVHHYAGTNWLWRR